MLSLRVDFNDSVIAYVASLFGLMVAGLGKSNEIDVF
jgi:hypothetical protein